MRAVRVSSNGSRYGQDAEIRQFRLLADEPPAIGGDDTGPTPFEYILTGLGSCKAITLQMYAERKGWALEAITVDLHYEKHENGHRIYADLTVEGDLDEQQRERLRELSDRCPVQRLLTEPIQIQTKLTQS
ncbi:MAG: OsmC family protein [Cyanobacteria bacterium P01_F01_bin.150]